MAGHDPRGTASGSAVNKGVGDTSIDAKVAKGGKSPSIADDSAVRKAKELGPPETPAKTVEETAAKKAADDAAAKKASSTLNKANTAKALETPATASRGLVSATQSEKKLAAGGKALELAETGEKALGKIGKAKYVLNFV